MRVKRKDLFDAVWSTPMRTLAREWGLSDVGLSKVCRKHGIPKPGLGYWAKVAAGQPAMKPLLEGDGDVEIAFNGEPALRKRPLATEMAQTIKQTLAAVPAMPHGDALLPWAKKTSKALSKKPTPTGFLIAFADCFRARVSPSQSERTVFILNALEAALTNAGAEWMVVKEGGAVTARLNGELLPFEIFEKTKRTEHIEKHPTYAFLDQKTYSYEFLGELTIKLDTWHEGRKSWSDGKLHRLEQKLQEVVEGFVSAAEMLKNKRTEREQMEAKRAAMHKELLERQAIEQAEHAFVRDVLKDIDAWKTAAQLREYVDAVREAAERCGITLSEEKSAWLQHVVLSAERLDPIKKLLS